jgi:hypothetical protein
MRQHIYWTLTTSSTYPLYYVLQESSSWRPTDEAEPIQINRIPKGDGSSLYAIATVYRQHTPTSPSAQYRPPTDSLHPAFDLYLRSIPKLDYYLLKHTSFHNSPTHTIQAILRASERNETLYVVTDGSKNNQSMSFGWVLGTEHGQKLAWGYGPGYGTDTSHRAECWGQLSAAKFILHLAQFTTTAIPPQLKLISFSDNKGMIKTLQTRQQFSKPYPNITLKPDWDLTESIFTTFLSTGINNLTFSWVKGHQDSQKPFHQLPIEAQFNVTADHLAETYMTLNARPRLVSPIPESARCSLLIKGISVHGHYLEAIRDAASLPELYGHLRKKFKNWTRDTLTTISWRWFKSAAKTYHHTDNHLMKLVYDHLPTRHVKNKKSGQSWIPDTCQFCDLEPETFEHLLNCNHPEGQTFRRLFPQAVRQYCSTRGAPHNFQSTLVIATEDWIRDKSPLQNVRNRPIVQSIAKAQSKIGWSNFFKGFLSDSWKQYLEHEIAHAEALTSKSTTIDPDTFFTGLIKVFWTQQSQFWMTYQKNLHQPPSPNFDPIRLQELKLEVTNLYNLKTQVPYKLRDTYFPSKLSLFLQSSSIAQLQIYINTYKPSILASIKTEKLRQRKTKPLHQTLVLPYYDLTHLNTNQPLPRERSSQDL